MARLPRLTIPGMPHHVVLRGNNLQPIFLQPGDYQSFLDVLAEQLRQNSGLALHAYALLENRLHLLVTPADERSLSRFMQGLGRQYVRLFNQTHQRSGTLWEGRFRSGVLQPSPYVLGVMTYLDWLPVRDGLAQRPADYAWTSHRNFAGLEHSRFLTPHPLYWDLADTPFGREAAYRELVDAGIGSSMLEQIHRSAMGGWALGNERFLQELGEQTQRRLQPGKPGRPRKRSADGGS
ncbi:transposase [Corticibacter populi]|uniref:Transposase n=1 Tax=Corticibacter populi TaxID=1550736 RepID=A0A3M6QZN6_9BURK|nr:transposase [Corticibacter populi]RMX08079.1 transposase [Corticibacter populi]RZS35327.1 putative transposase [Corticibacter populi]